MDLVKMDCIMYFLIFCLSQEIVFAKIWHVQPDNISEKKKKGNQSEVFFWVFFFSSKC